MIKQGSLRMTTFTATRWWSRWEVIEQVAVQFGDVLPFLCKEDLGSATTMAKLMPFLQILRRRHCL